jgi:hypothetical protein
MNPENTETLRAILKEAWIPAEILDAEGGVLSTGQVILSEDGSGLFQPSGRRRIDNLERLAKSARLSGGHHLLIESLELCIAPSCDYHIHV